MSTHKPQDPVALIWSPETEPNGDIMYNHVTADTPLGRFSIEWEGWKDNDPPNVYLDGKYINTAYDLAEGKKIAAEYIAYISKALAMYTPDVHVEPVALAASAQKPVGYVSQDFLDGKWNLDHIAKSDEGQISRTIPVFSKPLSEQPSAGVVPEITATFECESNGITGSTTAPVKRIDHHDDGCIEVVIDHWPEHTAKQQPLSHDWDDQDKCRRCGDRDWYASAICTPKHSQTGGDA